MTELPAELFRVIYRIVVKTGSEWEQQEMQEIVAAVSRELFFAKAAGEKQTRKKIAQELRDVLKLKVGQVPVDYTKGVFDAIDWIEGKVRL